MAGKQALVRCRHRHTSLTGFRNPASNYARDLVTGLVRRGVEVTLVSFGHIPEPRQLAWTEPAIAEAILSFKKRFAFRALFHDTHHRAYTNASEILHFPLHLFDGVLAFGEPIRRIYVEGFGVPHAWTFHEAADVTHFRPMESDREFDLLWIGNWGDEERTQELKEFFISPMAELRACHAVAYGVRYSDDGRRALAQAGIEYFGYLPSLMAPQAYARAALSLHVPRR